jgi:hypothetical protein
MFSLDRGTPRLHSAGDGARISVRQTERYCQQPRSGMVDTMADQLGTAACASRATSQIGSVSSVFATRRGKLRTRGCAVPEIALARTQREDWKRIVDSNLNGRLVRVRSSVQSYPPSDTIRHSPLDSASLSRLGLWLCSACLWPQNRRAGRTSAALSEIQASPVVHTFSSRSVISGSASRGVAG